MADKNYYMDEKIGSSGVAATSNPARTSWETNTGNPFKYNPRNLNLGQYFDTHSQYDESLGDVQSQLEEGLDIGDMRAEQQSFLDMMGNALVNNVVIAGTTAVSGTLGLGLGVVEALAEGDISKVWDNEVNNWAVDTQEAAREALPIYRGKQYEGASLASQLGSGIFWADLVQNLGFVEGMLIPGMGVSKVLSSAPSFLRGAVSSLVSSIGEASTEAINNKNDEIKNKQNIAYTRYKELFNSTPSGMARGALNSELQDDLTKIEQDAINAGNLTFGANVALLTLTNAVEFGDLFSRGFNTANRITGGIRREGNRLAKESLAKDLFRETGATLINAASEGGEEFSQNLISNIAHNYKDYNTFNESKFNPDKREIASDMIAALGQAYAETMGDKNTATEFASGFITGIVGVPTFRKGKSGKWGVGIENNAVLDLYDKYSQSNKERDFVNETNQRLEDGSFATYYNGLVRKMAIQDAKNAAVENNDKYSYNNADAAGILNDIRTFEEVGALDHLRGLVESVTSMDDAQIEEMIQQTSKDGEGPFMHKGNADSVDDVKKVLAKKAKNITNKIDEYNKTRKLLETTHPDYDEDTINNITYLNGMISDHRARKKELSEEVFSNLKEILLGVTDEDGTQYVVSRENFLQNYLTDAKYREAIQEMLNSSTESSYLEIRDIISKLNDIERLNKGEQEIQSQIKDLMEHPNKSAEQAAKNEEKAIKEGTKRQANKAADKVVNTATPDLVAQLENGSFDPSDLETLEQSDSTNEAKAKVKNAQEIVDTKKKIHQRIDGSNMSSSAKNAAHQMIDNSAATAESISQLLDTNGEAFWESEGALDLSEEDRAEISQLDADEAQKTLQDLKEYAEEEARQELQSIFNELESDKAEMASLTTDEDELLAAMGNGTHEDLQAAVEANKKRGEVGADPIENIPPVNTATPTSTVKPTTPKVDIYTESDSKANSNQIVTAETTVNEDTQEQRDIDRTDTKVPKKNGSYQFWKSNTTEEALYNPIGDHTKWHDSGKDSNAGAHKTIYEFLDKNSAFTRTKQGLITAGSRVKIGFSKSLNEKVGTTIPLIMVEDPENKGNYVVVGDMISALDDYSAFPNYKEFLDRINKAIGEGNFSEDINVLDVELSVNKVLKGRPNYSPRDQRRTLNEVANGREFKLGVATKNHNRIVVDSRAVSAAPTVTEHKVLAPLTQSPGQPFILVGDKNNGYMCVPIRLPKFNVQEADKSALGREVKSAALNLDSLNGLDREELTLIKDELQSLLNFEHLWINKSKDGTKWVINYRVPGGQDVHLSYSLDTKISDSFLERISKDGVGYQVDIYRMNNPNSTIGEVSYNEAIGELATTNLEVGGLELVNNFPILNMQDALGTETKATAPAAKSEGRVKADRVVNTIENLQSSIERPTPSNNVYIINGVPYQRVHTVMGQNSTSAPNQQAILNGDRAKTAGTEVDSIVRQFFMGVEPNEIKYNNAIVSPIAFTEIIKGLSELKKYFDSKGETVYANNLVIGHDFNGTKVAGEIDILTVDKDGNFRVYDMKTSKNSFAESYYGSRQGWQIKSTREEHSEQLNFYADMLEQEYGIKVVDLNIIPFSVTFTNGKNAISGKTDPVLKATRLPFINLKRSNTSTNSSLEGYKNRTTPKKSDSDVKKDSIDESTNNTTPRPTSATATPSTPQAKAVNRENIIDELSNKNYPDFDENVDLVKLLSDEQLTKMSTAKAANPKTKLKWQTFINSIDRSKPLDSKDVQAKFNDAFNSIAVAKFSTTENTAKKPYKVWNRKVELRRLARILPKSTIAERLKIVEKIEEVAGRDNPLAWGKYVQGIITLYNNAVAGTSYHEAFHAVIDTLLSPEEQITLFSLAREEFGNKSMDDLEEDLAEGFKEYSLLRDDASISQKLKNFFKDLLNDIKHWFGARDSLNVIYSRAYRGKYASRKENIGGNIYSGNQANKYSLIGAGGAFMLQVATQDTTKMDNYYKAMAMEEAGKTASEIWIATGWQKDIDNKWRTEIGDVDLDLSIMDEQLTRVDFERSFNNVENYSSETDLGLILKDNAYKKELFTAYPNLKRTKVKFVYKPNSTNRGAFSQSDNTIELNLGHYYAPRYNLDKETFYKSIQETLLHELQHYIQSKEGFSSGTNVSYLRSTKFYEDFYSKAGSELTELLVKKFGEEEGRNLLEKKRLAGQEARTLENLRDTAEMYGDKEEIEFYQNNLIKVLKFIEKANKYIKEAIEDLDENERFKFTNPAYWLYLRNAGETEARNVAHRHNLSDTARKYLSPSETIEKFINPEDLWEYDFSEESSYEMPSSEQEVYNLASSLYDEYSKEGSALNYDMRQSNMRKKSREAVWQKIGELNGKANKRFPYGKITIFTYDKANNKIKLVSKKAFINSAIKSAMSYNSSFNEMAPTSKQNTDKYSFTMLPKETQESIKARGITEESWSKLDNNQKEYALSCLGVTL